MPAFHLQTPAALIALLALLPLAWLWIGAARRSAAAEEALTGAPARRGANACRGILRVAALGLLVFGLSGPYALTRAGTGRAEAPVVFVLDLSASMMADDVEPNRLAVGRDCVERIAGLLSGAPLGLVLAGIDPVVACPLTEDRGAFAALLAAADETRLQQGTRLAPAVMEAARMLGGRGGVGAILLVSDGEDEGPPPSAAIRAARARGAVLHSVTVGSEAGVPVTHLPVAGDAPSDVRTRARPHAMAAWAAEGGGQAWRAGPGVLRMPASAAEVLPPGVAAQSARWHGGAADLAWLCYAVAAVLLAADLLLRA
jgi:hypothetical protein